MSARDSLTPEMRAEVLRLEDDLRARVTSIQEVQDAWHAEYDAARAAERTAAAWEAWVDERVTLAAVAWVLTTVFVRFCEDNALVKPVWISGPRHREAIDAQQQFLRETARTNADVTDREWLLQAVDYLKSLPATTGLVDDTSPMWLVTPSGDAATRIFNFWRERDESGALIRDLSDLDLDTRFLGDLYQEISEDAKKRYALLQTPVFVEEFILDRTLEPALNERPLDGFKMIDPTCGSGHFLLGSFQRLLDHWHKHAPGLDERERVQLALDAVHGVDINPFAVAVARFRLTVKALQACGLRALEDAPAFRYHLAVGDSLVHGGEQLQFDLGAELTGDQVAANFAYATENLGSLRSILRNRQYDVVVGNPPYIEVKDANLRALYRRLYPSCKGNYVLSVPFMEKFFSLAKSGDGSGFVGQITSNSFAQREFGKTLIEKFLPRVDLTQVINSEGAWIPGHNMDGTPTVILVGRNRTPSPRPLRVVLSKGIRESGREPNGTGPYWTSLVDHLDDDEFENEWVSIRDTPRADLARHPWNLVGGGIRTLIDSLSTGRPLLGTRSARIGFYGDSHADELFFLPFDFAARVGLHDNVLREASRGSSVRDWVGLRGEVALLPYDSSKRFLPESELRTVEKVLWPWRTTLWSRKVFDGSTYREAGQHWLAWHQLPRDEDTDECTIAYAEVAPDPHFILDDGSSVFNRTAPVIKLPTGTSDQEHWNLVLNLNSSVACCWLRDQSKPKGGAAGKLWARTHQFNGSRLKGFPIAGPLDAMLSTRIRAAVEDLDSLVNGGPFADGHPPTRQALDAHSEALSRIRGLLIALQEELDWSFYHLYGLVDEELTHPDADIPSLAVGERSFEIALAQGVHPNSEAKAWLQEPHVRRSNQVRDEWPQAYGELVSRRIDVILNSPLIAILESPEHKRRWSSGIHEAQGRQALVDWCLDRLSQPSFWLDSFGRPTPKSVSILADDVGRDSNLSRALELLEGRPDVPLVESISRLVDEWTVPALAVERFTESGLRNLAAWQSTWAHQRVEDKDGFTRIGAAPAPPVYSAEDYRDGTAARLRGRVDIPRERFVRYPNASRDGDRTDTLGWSGWDQAHQALALATLIQSGEQQGWSEDRLTPLVAGLSEVLPWVEQWHTDPDPLYGGSSPAEFFSGLLDNYMAKLGATRESLAAWRPPAAARGRKAKS